MFRKQFKIKTSTTIKGSDRRKLRTIIETSYPNISPETLNSLISNKSEMNQAKAMTHSGSIAMIYYSGPNPIFFQIENKVYPTIYTLWKFPKLLPVLTTTPPVLEKIVNGADLMAPGIIIDESNLSEVGDLKVKDICAIRICGNVSPIAVGTALLSKGDLCQDGIKGKAVCIVHCYKDTLWSAGEQQALPLIPGDEYDSLIPPVEDLSLGSDIVSDNENNKITVSESIFSHNTETEIIDNEILSAPVYTMDEVLYNSFMTALKVSGKKITLPLLTSTFYSTYVLKSCPQSLNLDIKKSTYKKLSVFLKSMQKQGLVQIKELTKGVESIVSINLECPVLQSYHIELIFKSHLEAEKEKSVEEAPSASVQENYKFPLVTELFVVSANVKILFEKFNFRKADTITAVSVKDVLKRYVKENSLQKESNPREVTLDPILSDCVCKKGEHREVMTWEQLQEAVLSKMPHAYQIEFEDKQPVVKKGKLEPIQVSVDTRTGNKKVTLLSNLDVYGINPEKLAQHVQVAVAASTSITTTQNGKGVLVLIQGNQVKYLQKLFLEIYKVPRKYIQGLENVPGKKK